MGNRCYLWDPAAGKLDNLPVVLPGVMVVQSKMCNAHQGGRPGTLLPLQHPDNWFEFPLPSLPSLFFHILILASYFSGYSCRAVEGGMLRVLSWDRAGIGTNPSEQSEQCPDPFSQCLSERIGCEAGGEAQDLILSMSNFVVLCNRNKRVQVPTHINQKHSKALNKS